MAYCEIDDEEARLETLHRYEVLDTKPEEAFERITRIARTLLEIPMVMVSLVDRHRQWFKSRQGLDISETPREISFCTHAIKSAQTFIVKDTHADPRFARSSLVIEEPYVRFYIGVPLRTRDGHNIGTLCAMDTKVRELRHEQIRMFEDLARLVVDELELRLLAATDSLTGAMTRRSFYERAQLDVERARRYFKSLSCAVIDIDNFKLVNDTHGHASGDRLVQHLVSICKSGLRASDYLGRIGGDEFAMMLPDTSLVDAFDVADRLRKGLAAAALAVSGTPLPVTVSIGIAEYIQPEASLDELLHDADAALYNAKSNGKNRVVCYLDDLSIAPDDPSQAPSRVAYSYRDALRKQAS